MEIQPSTLRTENAHSGMTPKRALGDALKGVGITSIFIGGGDPDSPNIVLTLSRMAAVFAVCYPPAAALFSGLLYQSQRQALGTGEGWVAQVPYQPCALFGHRSEGPPALPPAST